MIVVAATRVEYAAARKALPAHVPVLRCGVSLERRRGRISGTAVSCGIAGGLRPDLATGCVVVPRRVLRPNGTSIACEPHLVESLLTAARTLGYVAIDAPLVTSRAFVHGSARKRLAERGYAATDMETGLLDADAIACVRVILDTPSREISPAWMNPRTAVLHPRAWLDVPFLVKEGPRCAAIAAAVLARALEGAEVTESSA